MIQRMLATWLLVPLPFLNPACTFGTSKFTYQRRKWQPTLVLLPGKSHGRRSLVGYSPWGHKVGHESDFTFSFLFHALEKEMATYSSILAWRIPRTEEPGGLPAMVSHTVGQDQQNLATAAAHILLKSSLKDFGQCLANMWKECYCFVVWTYFGIVLLWDWSENRHFPGLWPLLSFPNLLAYWVKHFNGIFF